MLKAVLLSTAALALVATSADARPNVMVSRDGKITMALSHSGVSTPAHIPGGYAFSTLDKSKVGTYFCCYGSTLSGPSSIFGKAYAVAEQFIPSANVTVSKLYAGVGYVSGDDKVTLTLLNDSGSNSPGSAITHGTGTTTTAFGECCGVVAAKIKSTNLTAGTPYWVSITLSGADFDAAGFQVNNEVSDFHYLSSSSNGGSTWSSGVSETEYNPAIAAK